MSYVAEPASFKVLVNGKEFTSDPPALVVEGRTYLPLRAIGEALGVPVDWNAELNQAEVGNSAPVAPANTYSRNNPAPINTVQTYTKTYPDYYTDTYDYTISIRVIETLRGDAAWKKIHDANQFNDKPDEGYEYILAKIAMSAQYVENDAALNISEWDFDTFSGNNEEMVRKSVVEPQPILQGKIYAGGNTEGWIVVQVRKDDPAPKIVYDLEYDGTGGVWFALQ